MDGAERIAAERARQTSEEGYDSAHDDEHTNEDLAIAAACYAMPMPLYVRDDRANAMILRDPWPWQPNEDKRPHNGNVVTPEKATPAERVDLLVKAGALIAAEIDRLLRIPASTECKHEMTIVAGICTSCGYNSVDGSVEPV